ncbi:hypothetical protein ACJJTC_007911 [Scirpophaga incertulas]
MSSNSSSSGFGSLDQQQIQINFPEQPLTAEQYYTNFSLSEHPDALIYCDGARAGPSEPKYGAGNRLQEDQPKPKRTRTEFSDFQKHVLSAEFAKNQYISQDRRKQLAYILKLTERNIKVWFQNRRMDAKKAVVSTSEGVALGPELGNAAFDQWNYPGVPGPSAHQHYPVGTPFVGYRQDFQHFSHVTTPMSILEPTNGTECSSMMPVTPYEAQAIPPGVTPNHVAIQEQQIVVPDENGTTQATPASQNTTSPCYAVKNQVQALQGTVPGIACNESSTNQSGQGLGFLTTKSMS